MIASPPEEKNWFWRSRTLRGGKGKKVVCDFTKKRDQAGGRIKGSLQGY